MHIQESYYTQDIELSIEKYTETETNPCLLEFTI